jgi:hypothetical protein
MDPLVPDRQRFRNVNVICDVEFACVGGKKRRGQWRLCKGPKNGAVDSVNGASKGRWLQLSKKEPPFQVRWLFLIINIHKYHTSHDILCTVLCVKTKYNLSSAGYK